MSIALFTVFYDKLLKPTVHYRFSFLLFCFLFYLFFGSYIHVLLNSHIEYQERIKLTEYVNQFYLKHPCINERYAKEFLDFILNASNVNGIVLGQNGHKNSTSYPPSWVFGGETIFFTFTLLSTIGYGYLTPSTDNGKLFCVFYILIGVPLSFLIFFHLSERVEYLIKGKANYIHTRNINTMETHEITRNYFSLRKEMGICYIKFAIVGFSLITFIYVVPSIIFSHIMEYPSWSFLDALYFCYISISTVGFGDFIPGRGLLGYVRDNYRLAMTVYLFIGIIFNMVFTNFLMSLPIIRVLVDSFTHKPMYYTNLSVEDEREGLLNNQDTDNSRNKPPSDSILDESSETRIGSRSNNYASINHKTKIV